MKFLYSLFWKTLSHFPFMEKLVRKYKYEIKFLFVGGLNTAVGLGSYFLLVYFGMYYMLATVISNIIGTLHSYVWNKFFTFKSHDKSISEFLRFVSVYLFSFLLGAGVLYLLVNNLHVSKYWGGVVQTVICTFISFFGHRFFSFKNVRSTTKS